MVSGGNLCNIEGTTGITLNSGEGHWFRSSNRPSFVGGYLQRTCDTTMVHASFPRNVARKVQSSQVQGYFHHLERLMIHWCSNNWGYIGYMSSPLRCDQDEAAAVLCRCARSFWRVGHVELFARRSSSTELMDFLWHVFRRDFPELVAVHRRLDDLIMAFFQEFVQQQAELVAEWLRVGYVHGNMNSDNCLLCGQTLDYGPFAFMEGYLVAGLSFKYVLLLLSISQQTAGWSNFQFVWAGSTYQVWSQLPAIYFGQDWTLCLWPTTCCDARDSASSSGEHCPRPSCERTGWLCRALEEDHCSLIYWKSSTETSAEESMNIMVLACGTWGVHQCNNWWIHFVGFQRQKLGVSWIRTWDVSSKIELQHTSITFWTFEDFDETK